MTAAIFGLIGVIVGGVLSGVVSLVTDRFRERRAARAGALLVAEELIRSMPPLLALRQNPSWSAVNIAGFGRREEWDRHRMALQSVLQVSDWQTLSSTFIHLERAAGQLGLHPATKRLTDEEGWEMARTYLLVCLSLHIIGDATQSPPRWQPRKRRALLADSAAKKAKLMDEEMTARRTHATWHNPFDAPAQPNP